MTLIRGGPAGPDGLGGSYLNEVATDRTALWWTFGGRSGVLNGMALAGVTGQMAIDVAAGACLVAERDGSNNELARGYLAWSATTTRVAFNPASVAARNDALVAAFVDTEAGAVGTGGLPVGSHLVAVPGVSGTTTPRSAADITAFLGRGGWSRLADVPIAAADTQINMGGLSSFLRGSFISLSIGATNWVSETGTGIYWNRDGAVTINLAMQRSGIASLSNATTTLIAAGQIPSDLLPPREIRGSLVTETGHGRGRVQTDGLVGALNLTITTGDRLAGQLSYQL